MPRKYEQKQRAERQAETRRRIVEATVALHQELGVVNTSISAIAERAQVERPTVYRHFPDQRSLLTACTSHYQELNPLPELEPWSRIPDPKERLRQALCEIFAYFARSEPMMSSTMRDLPELPVLQEVIAPFWDYWQNVGNLLAMGWDAQRPPLLEAAIRHSLDFGTWQSLVRRQGLSDEEAVALLVELVIVAARISPD
jgi:AcrR family transcriptional regulator